MKKYGLRLLVAMLIGVGVQAALAKGPPQKVTITGGDLPAEIVITEDDQRTLDALAMMSLEDYETLSDDAPANVEGDGYLITRYYVNSGGRYFPFDQVRYYPDPAGGRGYVFYEGIVNGSSEYDGKWFRATQNGTATLDDLLAADESSASGAARGGIVGAFLDAITAFAGAR